MKKRMHLAFDFSYIHMDGRWRMPGAWPGMTYPDVAMFEAMARIAERGRFDMLFSGDGTGVLRVSGATAEQIGTAAWRAHLPVYELTPAQASLEEAFMQVTHDSVEYHAGATR